MNILLTICDVICFLFGLVFVVFLLAAIVATFQLEKSLKEYYEETGHSFSDELARKKREGK